jgi:hypothetical protein
MKNFLRLFRSARNRRRHSRIPLLGEYMKRLNETRPIFARCN